MADTVNSALPVTMHRLDCSGKLEAMQSLGIDVGGPSLGSN